MILHTTRGEIRTVVARWTAQYPRGSKDDITAQLRALNTETATAADVAAIIGNSTWTDLRCDDCAAHVACVVELGPEPDYESATASVCVPCLARALTLAQSADAVDPHAPDPGNLPPRA